MGTGFRGGGVTRPPYGARPDAPKEIRATSGARLALETMKSWVNAWFFGSVLGLAALTACSAGTSSASSGASPGAKASCGDAGSCAAPKMLGTVSGDAPSAPLRAQGSGSAWFAVAVTEDVDAWTGKSLHVTATVRGNPNARLRVLGDLAEHAPDGGVWPDGGPPVDCGAQGTAGPVRSSVELTWGESVGVDGGSANGRPDGRMLAIEVRDTGESCDAWELEVQGN